MGPAITYGAVLGVLASLDCEIVAAPDEFVDDDPEPLRFREVSRTVEGRRLSAIIPLLEIGDRVFPSTLTALCELLKLDPKLFEVE
jgi:hypothetical protein